MSKRTKKCRTCLVSKNPCDKDCPFGAVFEESSRGAEEYDLVVKKFYGGPTNFREIVNKTATADRRECAAHLKKEAMYRVDHPLRGMSGRVEDLEKEVESLSKEVQKLQMELAEYKAPPKKRKHGEADKEYTAGSENEEFSSS